MLKLSTEPQTSKRCILYIYSLNIGTEYFKHDIYSPFISLQNEICFIILTCLVPVLFTFYIQCVLKLSTEPQTSKRCILYIYSLNIGTEYFKHGIYSPFISLQNAVGFIILTCLVPVLFTFYIQGVVKLQKNLKEVRRATSAQYRCSMQQLEQRKHVSPRQATRRHLYLPCCVHGKTHSCHPPNYTFAVSLLPCCGILCGSYRGV